MYKIEHVDVGSGQITYRQANGSLQIMNVGTNTAHAVHKWILLGCKGELAIAAPALTYKQVMLLLTGAYEESK